MCTGTGSTIKNDKEIRLRQLLPLCSKRGFCSHGAALGTPVLHYNRCATPAKLPVCKCPARFFYSLPPFDSPKKISQLPTPDFSSAENRRHPYKERGKTKNKGMLRLFLLCNEGRGKICCAVSQPNRQVAVFHGRSKLARRKAVRCLLRSSSCRPDDNNRLESSSKGSSCPAVARCNKLKIFQDRWLGCNFARE